MPWCCTDFEPPIDRKTVRILAYSSTSEQSNKRSGTRLKTECETEEIKIFFSLVGRVRLARFASRAQDSYATLYRFLY